MKPLDEPLSLSRLPCLDGWRCVSILIVLLSHSERVEGFPEVAKSIVRWLPTGNFGVQFFFVISGFLITFLLFKEADRTGRISLRGFFTRRALRILPAYVVFLLVLGTLQFVTGLDISGKSWAALCTYTVNYIEVPWVAAHIWSLSIEEQFYLVWPFLFLFCLRHQSRNRSIFWVLAIPLLLSPICRALSYKLGEPFPINEYSFLVYADAMAYGCLLALLLVRYKERIAPYFIKYSGILVAVALFLIGAELIANRLQALPLIFVPLGYSMKSLGICLLIGTSLYHAERSGFRWLNGTLVSRIGIWSYSLYLWQQLFCADIALYGATERPWILTFPLWLIPTFVAAYLSYTFIESPFLSLKNRISRRSSH